MTVIETPDSRGGMDGFEGSSGVLKFIIQLDEEGEDEVFLRNWLVDNAPLTLDPYGTGELYHRKTIGIAPRLDGVMTFNVDVNYAQPKPATISFTTTGGSQKIRYSLGTVRMLDSAGPVAPGVDGPDFGQAINVTKDQIEGVDIITPQLVYKITRSWDAADITQDYLDDLEKLTGTVNDSELSVTINAVTRVWKAGEVRFDGADVQAAADFRVEITYTLSINKNIDPDDASTHWEVAGINITDKAGWDYIWFYSEETEDQGVRVQTPIYAVIEQVYYSADHSKLKLEG
jgi:hypothetical protein